MTKSKKSLLRELEIAQASTLTRITAAHRDIEKTNENNFQASAITITIKNINLQGKEVVIEEFAIMDGLTTETIEQLKKEIKKSHESIINHPINKIN